jgi:hypothetical protein
LHIATNVIIINTSGSRWQKGSPIPLATDLSEATGLSILQVVLFLLLLLLIKHLGLPCP